MAPTGKTDCVYVIWYQPADAVKIGVTTRGTVRPAGVMGALPPGHSELLFVLPNRSRRTEALLHRYFHDYSLRGEWFRPTGELWEWIKRHSAPSAIERMQVVERSTVGVTPEDFKNRCREHIVDVLQKLDPLSDDFSLLAATLARIYRVQAITVVHPKKKPGQLSVVLG